MAISRRLRFEILERDNHTCQSCGRTPPEVKLTVDHVIPKALGGTDDPSNAQALCEECNAGKSSRQPGAVTVAAVDQRAAQWADAMERVAERERQDIARSGQFVGEFDEYWCTWTNGVDEPLQRPDAWEQSVLSMRDAGMDMDGLHEAVRIAMAAKHIKNRDTWRYFCGVVWRRLEQRQQAARDLLASSTALAESEVDESEGKAGAPTSAEYGARMADLMLADLWVQPDGHIVHRAWGPCVQKGWFDPNGFVRDRTLAHGTSYATVQGQLGDRDGWAAVFCEDCCIRERELAWPDCFGESYATYVERKGAQDPWSTAHIPRRVDADEVYV